jgi:hypothetical protein
MRIVHGCTQASHPHGVVCYVCRQVLPIECALVDLDAHPVVAFYHAQCLVEADEGDLA